MDKQETDHSIIGRPVMTNTRSIINTLSSCSNLFALLLILMSFVIANMSFAGAITQYHLEENGIMVIVNGSTKADIVWNVQEDRYSRRNTPVGMIFWNRKTIQFDQSGAYLLPVDLRKAKEGHRYCVTVVNHSRGTKFEVRATVQQGKFFLEE